MLRWDDCFVGEGLAVTAEWRLQLSELLCAPLVEQKLKQNVQVVHKIHNTLNLSELNIIR